MNRVTQHLGTKYPIIQAPMGWIARSKLASSVSNAGGLGVIETSSGEVEICKEEIKKMVVQGMSDEEIKEHFVQKYGIEILANPPKKGFDTLVWLAPLFFGFFGIVFLYRYIFS